LYYCSRLPCDSVDPIIAIIELPQYEILNIPGSVLYIGDTLETFIGYVSYIFAMDCNLGNSVTNASIISLMASLLLDEDRKNILLVLIHQFLQVEDWWQAARI